MLGGVARWVAGLVVVAVVEQLLITSIVEVGVVVPRVARGAAPGVRVLVDLGTVVEVMGDSSAMYSWDYSDVRPPDLC